MQLRRVTLTKVPVSLINRLTEGGTVPEGILGMDVLRSCYTMMMGTRTIIIPTSDLKVE